MSGPRQGELGGAKRSGGQETLLGCIIEKKNLLTIFKEKN